VAIDASWLRDGGIARMAHEIIARRPDGVDVVEIRADGANAGFFTPIDLAARARAVRADAIWSPGFMPPALRVPGKHVSITLHDLAHLHHYSAKHRIYYNQIIRRLLGNVDRIFTVSDYTRSELVRWAGIDADRIVRVYNGVSEAFVPASDPALPSSADTAPYVLYVGNRRSYKNIDRLIAAFAGSGLVDRGYQLWLTGDDDGASSATATRHGIRERMRYLGRISDTALADVYRRAQALAFLSLYEGFGLPLVEAMACGCPVLTASTTALGEVAGEAALTVDPLSIEAIAQGLVRICDDDALRGVLRSAGLARAAAFRWDTAAARYWQVLTEARR
jgi:glycosyltransferase involved in cell wall biosynthesis